MPLLNILQQCYFHQYQPLSFQVPLYSILTIGHERMVVIVKCLRRFNHTWAIFFRQLFIASKKCCNEQMSHISYRMALPPCWYIFSLFMVDLFLMWAPVRTRSERQGRYSSRKSSSSRGLYGPILTVGQLRRQTTNT